MCTLIRLKLPLTSSIDMIDEADGEPALYVVVLYGVISFVCVMLLTLLLYVACARKYKLNWFERNLLETSNFSKDFNHSQEALVGLHESTAGSSKTLYSTPDDKFWIPINQQTSLGDADASTSEQSIPGSPTSSTSYHPVQFSGSVPIARNDKQIVLTSTSPVRPKMATMQSKLDHTKIDSMLYQQESPGEPEDVRGSVHVAMVYDPTAGILNVRLIEAQHLQAKDFSGTADPYAKIRLLPDKTNVWQTRIHKKTLNPVFDEDFVFEVHPALLSRHTLEILLYDFDAYSRHHNIGGIQIPLGNVDLNEKFDMWSGLGPCAGKDSQIDFGELMVSLAYLPSAERLTAVVMKARNLRVVDDTRNSSDPYVKVSLIQGTKKLKKRKTGVHRNTVNPVFNEALTFDIPKTVLKKCGIEICVMHDSLLGASEFLGRCLIGQAPNCKMQEKELFVEMLQSKTVTAWLQLSDPRTS